MGIKTTGWDSAKRLDGLQGLVKTAHCMQPGFFDFDDLNDKLDQHNDPPAKINELVDWAAFRSILSKIRMPR
ncbi:hypothetical protein Q4551_12880 [Oceanobacter sp. 5_MG-2023]|uniref:hypothetical protein n=1 Tax=Oceanobacter sp. 5_MG-2023 TaxID=3062645 RepID=UPI0026E34BC0|nr:hypothetical protein [Oceanobacter sp. 5_MG-2023]MDO6683182.1 hypothetical protein [Oceanobacter sp. 5_MG-2023]